MTQTPADQSPEFFSRIIFYDIPRLNIKLEKIIENRNFAISVWGEDQDEIYQQEAFAIATGCLVSILDIFMALYKHLESKSENDFQINVFPRSTNILIRSAIDNLSMFLWISHDEQERSISSKAFAFLIKNADEGRKYYSALGDSIALANMETVIAQFQSEGREYGFLPDVPRGANLEIGNKFSKLPSSTDLCARLDILEEYSIEQQNELKRDYPGIENAEFIYRYLSGHAHGYQWVTKYSESGEISATQKFIYWIPAAALRVVVREMDKL